MLGHSRGEAEPKGTKDDNALVTAARRAVGSWLRATPETRVYDTPAVVASRDEERARRMESFIDMSRRALKGVGEWIPPLATFSKERARKRPATVAGKGPGGFRARQYFILRCGDLPLVYVGRSSKYGRLIENSDPNSSPPAQWDISANCVTVTEPIGGGLEARLREIEAVAGHRAPFVTALRALVVGMTDNLWRSTVAASMEAETRFRSNGEKRIPKLKGKKLGEALLPPVPRISRKRVGDWLIAPDKRS